MLELKQFIAKDYCLSCRGCCRYARLDSVWSPQLLEEEKARIVPFSQKLELVANPQEGNFLCQFFIKKDGKCRVYTIRPFDCRLYPFLINRRGKKVFLSVDIKCPFIKTNAHIDDYKQYVHYITGFFNTPEIISILKKNPQIIQSYEDALDIVELKF